MPNNRRNARWHMASGRFCGDIVFYSMVTMGITMGLRLVCLNR